MPKYQQAKLLYAQQQGFDNWDEYSDHLFGISLDPYEFENIYEKIFEIYLTL